LVKQLLIFLQEFLQLFWDHVLSKFNFGEKFREWVQMLFKYAQTCIKTNGFVSKYFNISNPFWSEFINFGKTTFNLSARIFAIIL
jgi:type I site-specific restriction-modification system R (restriction) subunit